jgi:hypothetical protein
MRRIFVRTARCSGLPPFKKHNEPIKMLCYAQDSLIHIPLLMVADRSFLTLTTSCLTEPAQHSGYLGLVRPKKIPGKNYRANRRKKTTPTDMSAAEKIVQRQILAQFVMS